MQLLDLPDELLDICCSRIDELTEPFDEEAHPTADQINLEALRSLRLTCRRISPLASKQLFSRLSLLPTKSSAVKARSILEESRLSPLVKTICLSASLNDRRSREDGPLPSWTIRDENEPEWEVGANNEEHAFDMDGELSATFKEMMADIGQFRHLRRIELNFHREVEGPSADEDNRQAYDLTETVEYRDMFLRKLLSALNHAEHPASRLNSLSIYNLQDWFNAGIGRSRNFKAVLARLEELELFVKSEQDGASETEIEIPERHDFYSGQLREYWLQPLQDIGRLTRLKLYGSIPWGYLPKCDLRGLHFPKLKSLDLGNMTFTHEWQLEWILSHGSSLEELTLLTCPIITKIELVWRVDAEGYSILPPRHRGTGRGRNVLAESKYGSRWHDYFDSFREKLPHLRHFVTTHDEWLQCHGGPGSAARAFQAPRSRPAQAELSIHSYREFSG